ncbi:hypothetical protein HO133_008100 [Letharia lupina]|uniref:Uncharacterized protein n=1 Tax=Letharia lupina TaxID=560253 RepID=A0A8H6CRK0_9LECA|nr:uncharacterized protein HO133_008100 [Letharia lupina]KAF6228370.1 hypothetical protein HO133_008100 [Letharia lupina]
MASFPFFRLPPEVRNMIYRLLFETAHEDKTVTPDPTGSRRRNNLGHRTLNLSDSLPFLRTCQLVRGEATAVLYGNNVFRFDDHPHNSDEHTMPAFNTSVPYCDYLTMYFFLVSIGKSNREKLQHIHLDFWEATFVRYPEEVGIYGNLRVNAGASFIGDAVELLAASHNLQTVSVSFHARSLSEEDKWCHPSAMLDFYICPKLARKISAIAGIEQFKCLTTYEAREDEYDALREFLCEKIMDMRARMERTNCAS